MTEPRTYRLVSMRTIDGSDVELDGELTIEGDAASVIVVRCDVGEDGDHDAYADYVRCITDQLLPLFRGVVVIGSDVELLRLEEVP